MRALTKAKPLTTKEEFSGSSPAPFVGHYGYPNVNVGLLAPPQNDETVWQHDAPKFWSQTNLSIQNIVEFRTGMINSRFVSNIKQTNKLVELAQEVAMAEKPVDIDVALEKKPSLNLTTDQWTAPLGPQAKLKKVQITSNPKIPTRVQRFYDDHDSKAVETITKLYGTADENSLCRMLSVGIFGKNRKLVPTRWSITATDDILAKHFLDKVRDLPVGDYAVYFGSYLGNYYLILFFPEKWSYELFEMYVNPDMLEYSTDFEQFEGRKSYAENCAGGYYTVRMALAEHQLKQKRQNSVLALRFITDEYLLPLGVWVTREATRKALTNKPICFGSKELLLNYALQLCKKKFNIDISQIIKKSFLLKRQASNLKRWLI